MSDAIEHVDWPVNREACIILPPTALDCRFNSMLELLDYYTQAKPSLREGESRATPVSLVCAAFLAVGAAAAFGQQPTQRLRFP
jgi:hypothetical protein